MNRTGLDHIRQGRLRGRRGDGVDAFLGIPYAAPPARFRPPEPPLPWDGVRDATRVGPAAPQPRSRLAEVIGDRVPEQIEDCLSLNVWRPSEPSAEPRPVLVFLHGGGFSTGSGGLDWYDGARLARRGDLVVVTINYRLGVLGYLPLEQPNLGLLDQIQALRWVEENIGDLGGDPRSVTVAGQSGGAISIAAMMSGRAAGGLFQRAVLQSAPLGMRPRTPGEAGVLTAEFLDVLGADPHTAPVSELLAAQGEMVRRHPGGIPPFHLVAQDGMVAGDLVATVGESAAGSVRILMGSTNDEAAAYGAGPEVTARLFHRPLRRFADLLAAGPSPAWVYRFGWSAPGNPLGSCHGLELPFVFGNLAACKDAAMLAGADEAVLTAMVDVVQTGWIGFVRDGDPGWPVYGPAGPVVELLDLLSEPGGAGLITR
ncbi:carboxylesterase family protein [Actinoplanes sp. NPDC051343]|uniref:carboxylesterase family protein n=1 Tax=Actinoplanes sp. NPDC051343 TaxID=3363906 RepID=UPI0037ACB7A0